ncbi:MAG: hypothetical protein GKS00_08755 [Alphaproteobacteria bacterium]|nr:hypothetical protein [Alphaproteobacteria bacterium]
MQDIEVAGSNRDEGWIVFLVCEHGRCQQGQQYTRSKGKKCAPYGRKTEQIGWLHRVPVTLLGGWKERRLRTGLHNFNFEGNSLFAA